MSASGTPRRDGPGLRRGDVAVGCQPGARGAAQGGTGKLSAASRADLAAGLRASAAAPGLGVQLFGCPPGGGGLGGEPLRLA